MANLHDISQKLDRMQSKIDTNHMCLVKKVGELRTDFEVHKAVAEQQPKITGKQMTFITAVAGAIGAALSKIAGFFASLFV